MRSGFIQIVKNMGIGTTSIGTNGDKVLSMASGTAPTSSPSDCIQLYAEDVSIYNVTKLLLHCDGTDGSTTFTDSSGNNTITANNHAQIDTDQKKFGTGSCLFDGKDDYLSFSASSNFAFGTGDFTVDLQYRPNTNQQGGFIQFGTYGNYHFLLEAYTSSGIRLFLSSGAPVIDQSYTFSNGTWYHIAITRNGTNLRLFIQGTQVGDTVTNSTNIDSSGTCWIGRSNADSGYIKGWIDEVRVVKGEAKWTSNFTPPTEAYSADSEGSELKVRDELGNITTLSPHNFSLVEQSHPLAWSYYSKNNYGEINVDMFKVVKKIENISGKKLIFIKKKV